MESLGAPGLKLHEGQTLLSAHFISRPLEGEALAGVNKMIWGDDRLIEIKLTPDP